MKKQNLFEANVLSSSKERIGGLSADSEAHWGTMSAAQMLAHCAEVQEVMNGKPLQNTPFMSMLFSGMIRKQVVGEKPYRRGARTHPQYVVSGRRDFDTERDRLLEALEKAFTDPCSYSAVERTLMGKLTKEEFGWSAYKHLDHHLNQFGV